MPHPDALIALAGTLVVALIGFYQWRRQYSNPNRAANSAARREAWVGLWERLERIDLDLRSEEDKNPSLFDQIRKVNEFFMAHSLYFDDRDQPLIVAYIRALNKLREEVYRADDADVPQAFSQTMRNVPSRDARIVAAQEEVQKLRSEIKSKAQRNAAGV